MQSNSRDSTLPRWLGPGELALRLGISIKALRVYERAGLVMPGRRRGGWRTYGPKDIARLHEVLALKALGLSLAEVKQVLEAPASSLQRTLDIQHKHLVAQIGEAQRRLAAVEAARQRLDQAGSLDIDQLLSLTNETAVPSPLSVDQVEAIIRELAGERDRDSHLARFDRDLKAKLDRAGVDAGEFERSLSLLVADASEAARHGDPRSEAGRILAKRWFAQTALLGPDFARESRGLEGVIGFAGVLCDDRNLAPALAYLRAAVAAHPSAETPEQDQEDDDAL